MNRSWPHQGEEWTHKDGSGLVTISAMLETDVFYIGNGHKWTCGLEDFKKLYRKRDDE